MNDAVDADSAALRRCCRFACVVAALAAGALIAAVPHRARAQDSATEAQCRAAVQNAPQPPFALTPLLLRVLQPSIEPVPATDGLIHLAYMAQVTNLFPAGSSSIGIVEAGAADPTANYAPTGRNIELDHEGKDVTGQIFLFGTDPFIPTFVTSLPASNTGLMLFDVTYTDPAQVPPVLANAITYTDDANPLPGVPALTEPVPVGCVPLAVIHPPLVGHGWFAEYGCCTYAVYHRLQPNAVGGELWTSEQFAIDFIQLGPNNSAVKPNAPPTEVSSYWGYGAPVLAVAQGVVTEVVDRLQDTPPTMGSVPHIEAADVFGNHVFLNIGGGHYVAYAHLKLGTITVKVGQHVQVGQLIGNVGTTGNSALPHLHFQLMNRPSGIVSHGLPFVFDTQLREGSVSEADSDKVDVAVPVNRTGVGVKRNLMPARNDVFGFNLSR